MSTDYSNLKREHYSMPDDIRAALEQRSLVEDYYNRPAYQQNDYVGWIVRSKLPATRQKRLNQMLEELEKGGVYMGMKHPASQKSPAS